MAVLTAPISEREQRERKRGTSLSGGKVRSSRQIHGMKSEPKSSSTKPRKEYDTPFDDKGRCHYHKNVQMASKKMSGGWKLLCKACPKCMEENYNAKEDDDRSVRSGRSTRSGGSRKSSKEQPAVSSGSSKLADKLGADANGHDKNGCCVVHSHIQVAKKKVLGGWKVLRTCPACEGGEEIGLDDDRLSVCSGKSGKSARSSRSHRSSKSGSGKKKSSTSSHKTTSGRYGSLPFDGDGYCCQHPSVQLAKKKTMGGWKIIHDICPDCEVENPTKSGRVRRRSRSQSRPRSRSSSRRHRDDDNDDDDKSVSSAHSARSSRSHNSSNKKSEKIKKKRVKNLKTEDENGNPGRYSGYVDAEYRPHGNGSMKYTDEALGEWEGVWKDGEKVAGKTKSKSKF
ncbi:predicted protein [Thalassiosira pseudonana CCMP1335]|uniref:Uncharacterized protein n=1 Tax=Thalassiosira pseudonana TaxID=35128 RepID=B8BWU0_THAPS|nr:predicted protein [Thalassiosira pseudonana CCMP1335]EED93589.1 predicted protein [Thalassiosira pseudonana CCMP1335]